MVISIFKLSQVERIRQMLALGVLGIGGYVDLIFSSEIRPLLLGFEPRVKSSIRKSSADKVIPQN